VGRATPTTRRLPVLLPNWTRGKSNAADGQGRGPGRGIQGGCIAGTRGDGKLRNVLLPGWTSRTKRGTRASISPLFGRRGGGNAGRWAEKNCDCDVHRWAGANTHIPRSEVSTRFLMTEEPGSEGATLAVHAPTPFGARCSVRNGPPHGWCGQSVRQQQKRRGRRLFAESRGCCRVEGTEDHIETEIPRATLRGPDVYSLSSGPGGQSVNTRLRGFADPNIPGRGMS